MVYRHPDATHGRLTEVVNTPMTRTETAKSRKLIDQQKRKSKEVLPFH